MKLLLDERGDEVKVIEELTESIAGFSVAESMKLLLDRQGDQVKITDKVVKAAAGNRGSDKEVMKLLLDERRERGQGHRGGGGGNNRKL